MVAAVKFHAFGEAMAHKKHHLGTDTLKILLTNTAPDAAAHAVKADLTEIAAGNGYAAGGWAVSRASSGQTAGLYALKLNDQPTAFTATGGNVGPYRYAVLYNDTALNKDLIQFWDLGASNTLLDTQPFPLDVIAGDGTILSFT